MSPNSPLFKSGSRAELAVWDWQQKLFWHAHRVPDLGYHQLLRSLPVLVTESGFPVTFLVFEGNRWDKTTLEEMAQDLKDRFSIRRCIWVSNAELLSAENRKCLKEAIEKARALRGIFLQWPDGSGNPQGAVNVRKTTSCVKNSGEH